MAMRCHSLVFILRVARGRRHPGSRRGRLRVAHCNMTSRAPPAVPLINCVRWDPSGNAAPVFTSDVFLRQALSITRPAAESSTPCLTVFQIPPLRWPGVRDSAPHEITRLRPYQTTVTFQKFHDCLSGLGGVRSSHQRSIQADSNYEETGSGALGARS